MLAAHSLALSLLGCEWNSTVIFPDLLLGCEPSIPGTTAQRAAAHVPVLTPKLCVDSCAVHSLYLKHPLRPAQQATVGASNPSIGASLYFPDLQWSQAHLSHTCPSLTPSSSIFFRVSDQLLPELTGSIANFSSCIVTQKQSGRLPDTVT